MTMTNDRLERDPFREAELAERGVTAEVRWLGPEQRVTITLDLAEMDGLISHWPDHDERDRISKRGYDDGYGEGVGDRRRVERNAKREAGREVLDLLAEPNPIERIRTWASEQSS